MASTVAPLSEVAIANMAADVISERPLASLDDGTPFAQIVSRQFGFCRDEVARAYPWNFLKKRSSLAVDTAVPAFGWLYSYTVPTDLVRLLPLRLGGYLTADEIPSEYESGKILCNQVAPLKIRYIRRETNPTLFDPLFARALGLRLAIEGAMKVTGKSGYLQVATDRLRVVMAEAALINSLEQGMTEGYATDDDIFSVRGTSSIGTSLSTSQFYSF